MSNRLKMVGRWVAAMIVTGAISDHLIGRKLWGISTFIPFFGLVTGDTWSMPTPTKYILDFKLGIIHAIAYGNLKKLRSWFTRYHVPAGIQINNTINGISAVLEGKVTDVRGRKLYRVKGTSEDIRAITMGPQRTKEGMEYYRKKYPGPVKKLWEKLK